MEWEKGYDKGLISEYLEYIYPSQSSFLRLKIDLSVIVKIQNAVMKALNVTHMGKLRDRFEGQDFYNNYLKVLVGEITLEKLLNIKIVDWRKAENSIYNESYLLLDNNRINIVTFD